MTRRDFLATPAVALAAASVPSTRWRDHPKRWGQLTLVENDPPNLNVQYWVDYFRRCECDTVTFSAGGVVAYYPTEVPYHYRSQYLGKRDSFGDLVRGCRKLTMTVFARVDPHAAHEDMFQAHPDWLQKDKNGKIRHHPVMPELYLTCPHGEYNRQFLTEVIREVVSLYQVDGVFANRWADTSSFEICYCDNCRAHFRSAYGHDLPVKQDPRDKVWRDFTLWYQDSLLSLIALWDGEIKKIKSDSCFEPNNGGSALNALDWKRFAQSTEIMNADHQGRAGVTPPWDNGRLAKVYRSVSGGKPIIGSAGINLAVSHRWMKSVKGPFEQQVWMADGVANGFCPKFSKFGGVMEDERWMGQVERFLQWHKSAEKYLRDREPIARVGMVYSQQTGHYYGTQGLVADCLNGMYEALIEARVPFEMVHDHNLDTASLSRFKLLVLPNIAALSDAQCTQLRDFTRAGGSLVATFETSLYDEWGEPRKEFGLADVLGIRFRGKVSGPLRNSYLAFHGKPGQRHPLLAGFDDAAYTVNCSRSVDTDAAGPGYQAPITLIPGYPDLPMEYVYERVPRGNTPQVFLSGSGASRTVYFPMDIDRTFWEILLEDHGRLLGNAVRWALNEAPPITVSGPGILDITFWRQPKTLILQMVNFTNPMMMRGPIRELTPVGEQTVRLRLPQGARVQSALLQVSGRKVDHRAHDGSLEVKVPSVLDHEMLVIELV